MNGKKYVCLVCGSKETVKWGPEFRKCEFCGLCFRNVMPTDEELKEIYAYHYSRDNISNRTTDMDSADESLKNHVEFISQFVKPEAEILDFGAGTGDMVKILSDKGFSVKGCEYAYNAREQAKKRYGFDFYSSLEESTGSYDLITGIEVVEHLKNPLDIMKQLAGLLRSKGILYITTPNTHGLNARMKKSAWREATKQSHLILYNYKPLKILLENAGFGSIEYVRFSPLTTSTGKHFPHRILQLLGLYGGLRVICRKQEYRNIHFHG